MSGRGTSRPPTAGATGTDEDPRSSVTATPTSFHVQAWERIDYSLLLVDGAFSPGNSEIAEIYRGHGRVLAVVDAEVHRLHGEAVAAYFDHHGIALTLFPVAIAETDKTMTTVEAIVDAISGFGLLRTEPVLVVGGGLTTDVAGLACSLYRRSTPYVRVPTTLVGLIDASVSIKVAVNHGRAKNRLGAYHASQTVVLDFSFLETLPTAQVRNGMAELVKIAVVASAGVFEALERHGEELLATRFGHADGTEELRAVAAEVTHRAVATMLELEAPNLQELDLDRVIAYGHTWSPTLELAPDVPLRHGHAIAVDMAYSATLAARRGSITEGERDRVVGLMSRLGLSIDSPHLTPELLERATASILATRDGRLRAAMPDPIGSCTFVDDLDAAEMELALDAHRELCAGYPRGGAGLEASTVAAGPGALESVGGMA